MRVIVADDAMLTREGIVHVLSQAGVDVVGQAGDAASLMRAIETDRPDVAIVDIRMPPGHSDEGIVAADEIHARYPDVAVLVLSQYVEPAYALRVIEDHPVGAGYLLKERIYDAAVLVDALRRLTEGETVVDPTIVARMFGRKRRDDPLRELTAREVETLALVAEGLSNRGIADRLVVTERTVEAHITQIFGKLGLEESPDSHRRVLAVLAFLRT
jgi:DNA-binding NarL/FixJ family response regulator